MENEMIERVARAAFEATRDEGANLGLVVEPWDAIAATQKYYRQMAREVIAAMREPTEAMMHAAEDVPAVARSEEATVGYFGAERAWLAMIDAALA